MRAVAVQSPRANWFDFVLVLLFLIGVYLGFSIQITDKIPIPSVPTGFVGLVMLWRRRDQIQPLHLGWLIAVLALYLGSIVSATNLEYLPKRFTGFVQLSYSLVLGYSLLLTLAVMSRRVLAGLFLGFSLALIVGCLLESYAGLKPVSDWVRLKLYTADIYEADLRDELLYGRVRPKLFTSEPASVTFAFTLYAFAWFVLSRSRIKLPVYVGLGGVGMLAMPGPTVLLMLLLLVPYYGFLHRSPGQVSGNFARLLLMGAFGAVVVVVFALLATTLFAERWRDISNGNDPSFFYRVIGPALVAVHVVHYYPWAGAGLTGEPFIANDVLTVYARSPQFSTGWMFDKVSSVLTNYLWLHWIYLGLVWGTVTLVGISLWLRALQVPSLAFCWSVWIILGQASGAYVGPRTWTVLFLSAVAAIIYRRETQDLGWVLVQPSPYARRSLRPAAAALPAGRREEPSLPYARA
jgi:hypothetical protein